MKSLGLIKRIFLLKKKISESKSKSEREDILFLKSPKERESEGGGICEVILIFK